MNLGNGLTQLAVVHGMQSRKKDYRKAGHKSIGNDMKRIDYCTNVY